MTVRNWPSLRGAVCRGGLASIFIVMLFTLNANAHWERARYTYNAPSNGNSGCTRGIDPITVLFRGYTATFKRVKSHIKYHSWGGNEGGSKQAILDHGLCFTQQGQLASGRGTRYHVRLWTMAHGDNAGRIATVGDAHYERLTDCGHAVPGRMEYGGSGFDAARRRMVRLFSSGVGGEFPEMHRERFRHPITHHNWGNRRPMYQCNGVPAKSNGDVAIIGMDRPR